jgi:DNA-binding CsgD family transcriptional regulator
MRGLDDAGWETAEALFVTRRTVETHLTQAYGKLEIGSREELPEALQRSS